MTFISEKSKSIKSSVNTVDIYTGVSKRSTVALLCYFLPQWCYFSFLVMKGAAHRATHGAKATVTCATAKSSLDTPAECLAHEKNCD